MELTEKELWILFRNYQEQLHQKTNLYTFPMTQECCEILYRMNEILCRVKFQEFRKEQERLSKM